MKLVVTGASGFVGRQIVPILAREGVELLLIGRDPDSLSKHFPNHTVCGYDTLETMATGFDALLHLAVLNNDVAASEAEFMAVNVDHLLEVLDRSRMAGVPRFINVSSIHALRPGRSDFYSVSKRVAAERLRDSEDVVTLYMPLLYGNRWGGRLAPLNRLPRPLARLLFLGLASLKPVAHVEALAAQVMKIDWTDRELIIADGQRRNPVFQIAKRAIDLIFAIMVLVLLWWRSLPFGPSSDVTDPAYLRRRESAKKVVSSPASSFAQWRWESPKSARMTFREMRSRRSAMYCGARKLTSFRRS